ncbi:MAG: hypothetical protein K2I03_11685 [Lachnospiraceae bacterium]|nr:hypothetical protein [Lachnospiraceae bacterium]
MSGIMSISVAVSAFTGVTFMHKADAAEQVTLNNPIIVKDSAMQAAGQKVTWDCVWFGSYPQTEVKNTDSEYAALQSATGWDGNNDIAINGKKYRRMLRGDVTFYDTLEGSYDWEDGTTYYYFRYEPVKWRVLREQTEVK